MLPQSEIRCGESYEIPSAGHFGLIGRGAEITGAVMRMPDYAKKLADKRRRRFLGLQPIAEIDKLVVLHQSNIKQL